MPYIDVNLSSALSVEKETILKKEIGQLIALIPGKTESSLMIQFKDCCRLWYNGKNEEPIAFVNVMLLGKASKDSYDALTGGLIQLFQQEMDVPAANTYVKFEEVPDWCWG
ncbi:phenylpyruvate tautomerase MIF-related protein [Scatolibacter rhodanostii]|uniref:phenylpyruvate tautomerase MIF-related protein n=1 Tax=Scatolibacter rhodanostii TaxID=2014781 RepID=UPI000C073832|nr:phenylpyruvate tautomerase MIF-related protein [Scatolibacter rhodanostii]